jgi:hypothetical protein
LLGKHTNDEITNKKTLQSHEMGTACSKVQPRASNGKSQHHMSFNTAFTASIATFQVSVGQEKSCMKVSTQALSLERSYGKDITSSATLSKHTAAIHWSTVEINSHAVILGDNPSVSSGPPITIGWKAFESVKVTVAEYEECNLNHRSPRALLLPKTVREDWLRNVGYSRKELESTAQAIQKTKEGRRSSAGDGRGWSRLAQQWTGDKNAHGRQRQKGFLR